MRPPPLDCDRRPPSRPWRTAASSAMIDSAVSRAFVAPRSRPTGALIRAWSSSGHAGRDEALATVGLRALGAHRADVGARRLQRDQQRRVVELGIVREDDDVRRLVGRAELLEGLLGPGRDDAERVGEALGRGEARARIDDVGPPAADAGQRRQVLRVLDGAEDDDPRIGVDDVDEEVAANLGALLPHELLGVGLALGVELGVAERALRRAVGAHEQLLALVRALHDGDERGAPVLARDLCELLVDAHGSKRSTQTSISPPHGSPTSQASSSAMPNVSSCGSPPLVEDLVGDLDDRALDAAAGHHARDLAAVVDRHLRARRARRRAARAGDGGDRHLRPFADPAIDVLDYVLHRVAPSTVSRRPEAVRTTAADVCNSTWTPYPRAA